MWKKKKKMKLFVYRIDPLGSGRTWKRKTSLEVTLCTVCSSRWHLLLLPAAPKGLLQRCSQRSGRRVKPRHCKLMFELRHGSIKARPYHSLEGTSFLSRSVPHPHRPPFFPLIQTISFEITLWCCLSKCQIAIRHLWRPVISRRAQTSVHYSPFVALMCWK